VTRIELADLGEWGAATLVAEYDPEDDAIRVNARAVARVRAALGDAEAERFVACAVAHERAHRADPRASEAEAHAFARAACGVDPRRYEALLARPDAVA
jgi:hypothetical protein